MTYNLSYERADSDSKGPRPGTVALRDYILAAFPGTRDLGIYAYRPIRGSTSSLSVHSEGRAWDCGVTVTEAGREVGDAVAAWVERHAAAAGIQYMIWYERSWRSDRGWRSYSGTNPHIDHVHLEQTRAAADTFSVEKLTPSIPLGPEGRPGIQFDPPQVLRPTRSAVRLRSGGEVRLADNGDIYCFGAATYYGGPNHELLGRDIDMLGEPDYLLQHETVDDGYIVVTDLRYSYRYP
jgi:hypothetical protein